MNILFTADNYKPQVNGIVTYILYLRKELERRKHRVILATTDFPNSEKETDVIRIPSLPFPFRSEDRIPLIWNKPVISRLRQEKFDIVHNQTFLTGFLGEKIAHEQNIPGVVTYHTPFNQYIHRLIPGIEKPLSPLINLAIKKYFNQFDQVITPSPKTIPSLKNIKTEAKVIPNGIELDIFKNSSSDLFLKKYNIDPARSIITIAGRLDRGKNIELAVEAVSIIKKQIPEILLAIIGDGTVRKKVENLVKKLDLRQNVILTGFVSKEILASAHRAARLSLMLSVVDNLPTVAIEAIACGKPMIAINDDSIKLIVFDNINGLLVNPTPTAVAQATFDLLQHPLKLGKFGKESSRVAEKFSIEFYVDKLEILYKDLIIKKQAGSSLPANIRPRVHTC